MRRLLVANRGEVACRIFRTARKSGLTTIAVFTEPDRYSKHVREADEAYDLGDASGYLDICRVLQAAATARADAVHPGFGFLAENAEFAERLEASGIIFIGPTPQAMRLLGNKVSAKEIAARCGVPMAESVLIGVNASLDAETRKRIIEIGLPVLIKAADGGGGRGIRIVESESELDAAISSASREALLAFGSGIVFVEKAIRPARHIEVQVLADSHGTVLILGDRDCTLQRKQQKLVEEAPAPDLSDASRTLVHESARRLASEAGYRSAGTVEFLISLTGEIHFLEVNTRLQVEHPVTEMIYGLDIVELQLRIARGEALCELVRVLQPTGHAIEARVLAETFSQGNSIPSSGNVFRLDGMRPSPTLRYDFGVDVGDAVGTSYDSMIGKIIAHGSTRNQAREELCNALRNLKIFGVLVNTELIAHVVASSDFASLRYHTTSFSELAEQVTPVDEAENAAALAIFLKASRSHGELIGFRLSGPNSLERHYKVNGEAVTVSLDWNRPPPLADNAELVPDSHGRGIWLATGRGVYHVEPCRVDAMASSSSSGALLHSPLPGVVAKVLVSVGDEVTTETPLISLESMKMEHLLRAPQAGKVVEIAVATGTKVERGTKLVVVDA